jgi:hypothetical protein
MRGGLRFPFTDMVRLTVMTRLTVMARLVRATLRETVMGQVPAHDGARDGSS